MSRRDRCYGRRTLLRTLGVGAAFPLASGIVTAKNGNGDREKDRSDNLNEKVREQGFYGVTIPGSSDSLALEDYYRSKRPLRMESDVGGIAQARPHGNGVKLNVDITERDGYTNASVNVGRWDISEISKIHFDTTSEIVIGLVLGIDLNNGTFAEWDSVEGNKERWQSFDGDDRAVSILVSNGDSPITREDGIFKIPPNGAINPDSNLSISDLEGLSINDIEDLLINDLQNEIGNVPVGVNGTVTADGESENVSNVNEAVIERLDVETVDE